jgi:DNA repair exonuclease SbcCD ATPase subunit
MKSKQWQSRSELKAELVAEAEARIEELLSWREQAGRTSLSAIEEKVMAIREQLSVKLTEGVIRQRGQERQVPGPACPGCQQEMRYKESHELRVNSWVGELKIERGYYYCAGCQRGLFPPG